MRKTSIIRLSVGGSFIDDCTSVQTCNDTAVFPCPFCRSRVLVVTGGNRKFLHYRCGDCAETWTAMRSTQATRDRRTTAQGPISPSTYRLN